MTASSYDHAPYSFRAHTVTHPRNLAAAALLLGVPAPPVDSCRVLELGCARGGNLIPMAQDLPGSQFMGIDYSPRQIEEGRSIIEALGLGNIQLLCEDITQLQTLSGKFDYIIAHGLYSWVPGEVRDQLLSLCKERLAENGVAYVSYNTYPGWFPHRMLREIMLYHVRHEEQPEKRVQGAREILNFLSQVVPAANNPYGMMLRQMAAGLSGLEDAYLLHDHLEEANHPVYFSQFTAHAAGHGLSYLGDAQYLLRGFSMLPPAVADRLRGYCKDELCLEQYLDFMSNESFRRSLLCHEGVTSSREIALDKLETLYFTALSMPVELPREKKYEGILGLKNAHGSMAFEANPLAQAALRHLCDIFPRPATFPQLWDHCMHSGITQGAGGRKVLAARLIQALMAGMIEAATVAAPLVTELSTRPCASRLARWQCMRGREVTNLRHGNVELDDFSCQVLSLLDGQRDYDTLLQELAKNSSAAGMVDSHQTLGERLAASLQFLSRAALLTG